MTIKELTLLSDNLAETKQFYTRILGLPIVSEKHLPFLLPPAQPSFVLNNLQTYGHTIILHLIYPTRR